MFKARCSFQNPQACQIAHTNASVIIHAVKCTKLSPIGMEMQFSNKTKFLNWIGRIIDLHMPFSFEFLEVTPTVTRTSRNDDLFAVGENA